MSNGYEYAVPLRLFCSNPNPPRGWRGWAQLRIRTVGFIRVNPRYPRKRLGRNDSVAAALLEEIPGHGLNEILSLRRLLGEKGCRQRLITLLRVVISSRR